MYSWMPKFGTQVSKCNAASMRDSATMDDGGADVVDELIFDQVFAVPDRVEDFTHRERRHRMLADEFEALLVFRRRRIFQPEQAVRLEVARKPCGLNRRQAMMHVMKELDVGPV